MSLTRTNLGAGGIWQVTTSPNWNIGTFTQPPHSLTIIVLQHWSSMVIDRVTGNRGDWTLVSMSEPSASDRLRVFAQVNPTASSRSSSAQVQMATAGLISDFWTVTAYQGFPADRLAKGVHAVVGLLYDASNTFSGPQVSQTNWVDDAAVSMDNWLVGVCAINGDTSAITGHGGYPQAYYYTYNTSAPNRMMVNAGKRSDYATIPQFEASSGVRKYMLWLELYSAPDPPWGNQGDLPISAAYRGSTPVDAAFHQGYRLFGDGLGVGDMFMDGYFVGIIDTTRPGSIDPGDAYQEGKRYMLILHRDDWRTNIQGGVENPAQWTRWDGLSAQRATLGGSNPDAMSEYCAALPYPADGGSEWYFPALDEMELAYRAFHPFEEGITTDTLIPELGWGERTWTGENPSSSPPRQRYSIDPAVQTRARYFKGEPLWFRNRLSQAGSGKTYRINLNVQDHGGLFYTINQAGVIRDIGGFTHVRAVRRLELP